MSTTINASKTFNYLYKFDIEFYTPSNSKISVKPLRVHYAVKTSVYTKNIFPTFKLEVAINRKDLLDLEEYEDSLLANVTIIENKYSTLQDNGGNDGEKMGALVETKIALNHVFQPIFDKRTFNSKYRKDKLENDTAAFNDNEIQTKTVNIKFDIYSITGNAANKTIYNTVFGDATPGTALLYILNKCGLNRIIVDPPANENEYDNIIIPPHNLRAAIEDLQSRYGIYENGILVYYDFNTFYVLDRYALTHEFESGDTIEDIIQIREGDQSMKPLLDIQENDDKSLLYDVALYVENMSSNIASGELDGNQIMFSNYKMGINSVGYTDEKLDKTKANPSAMVLKRNNTTHKYSGDKTVFDYDELNNVYNMASYFNALETLQNRYRLNLKGVSLSTFKPNKFIKLQYIDVVKDKLNGGRYIQIGSKLDFIQTNEMSDLMICNASLNLARRTDI